MLRTIHFIAGLPRSGSTLLCNLLAQNPRFHTTSTSGIITVVRMVHDRWRDIFGNDTHPAARADRARVMGAVLHCYHDEPLEPKPVIFDKSRGWLGQLDMAEMALGRKVKVLVCVRDVRDVLASFEKLWRKNAATWAQGQELGYYSKWQTIAGRCEVLMRADQVVGSAYRRIKRALVDGYRDRMHFVEFEKITANPREVMRGVYAFLGEEWFEHDFDNVEQVTTEDDFMHGIPGLHTIRQKIEPVPSQWEKYLGEAGERYKRFNNLWRGLVDGTQAPAYLPGERKAAQGGVTGFGGDRVNEVGAEDGDELDEADALEAGAAAEGDDER
jgi:sulfotransferase